MIKNVVNGKMYVGQAADIYARWIHHKSDLNNNRHHNKHLQYSWNKYGEENFIFNIIEECSINNLDKREKYWINKLRTYEGFDDCNGYNQDLGGKGIRGYKHSDDQILKMRMVQGPKAVLQFDLQFNLIKEWVSVSQINKECGYTKECILLRCNHTILNKMTSYKCSYWLYKEEYENDGFSWDNYLSNYREKNDKIICQYDLGFNLIKKWDSHLELKKAGYDLKSVLQICNHHGTLRTSDNYIWAYDGYDFSDGYFGYSEKYEKGRHNCRKVNMKLEKDGDIINTFDSVSDACIFIGKPVKFRSNIVASLTKGQRSCGYYWEYADLC